MSLNDTISDMLNRIRNAVSNRVEHVDCLNSKICAGIAGVLKDEGYIDGYNVVEGTPQGVLRVDLKYGSRGEPVILRLKRESKPGCRVYRKADQLPRPLAGLGIAILSTPVGVLSDRQARHQHVGGELLCTVE